MPLVATLSRSILSAHLARPADQVKLVEQDADVFHIDILDARFVNLQAPAIAAGARDLALVAGRRV